MFALLSIPCLMIYCVCHMYSDKPPVIETESGTESSTESSTESNTESSTESSTESDSN
jgi:hypothetical protein